MKPLNGKCFLILILFLLLNQISWATPELIKNMEDDYNRFTEKIIKINKEHSNFQQTDFCKSAYNKTYNKSNIYWSIFFGYGDLENEPYTTDIYERSLFEKSIQAPCENGLVLCEFTEDKTQNQTELSKKVFYKTFYPKWSSYHGPITVWLTLYNSSLTTDSYFNKNQARVDQIEKSKQLEKLYLKALNSDDWVFYSGHARHGTGPGFRPLDSYSADWWKAVLYRPMMGDIYQTLSPDLITKTKKSQPHVIGMFVCDAEGHYGTTLHQAAPDASLLLTRNTINGIDNLKLLYAASNALLNQSCEDEFQQALNSAIMEVYYYKSQGKPKDLQSVMPKFFNFFHEDSMDSRNDLYMSLKDEFDTELRYSR